MLHALLLGGHGIALDIVMELNIGSLLQGMLATGASALKHVGGSCRGWQNCLKATQQPFTTSFTLAEDQNHRQVARQRAGRHTAGKSLTSRPKGWKKSFPTQTQLTFHSLRRPSVLLSEDVTRGINLRVQAPCLPRSSSTCMQRTTER